MGVLFAFAVMHAFDKIGDLLKPLLDAATRSLPSAL
jgi:hypothetical protein